MKEVHISAVSQEIYLIYTSSTVLVNSADLSVLLNFTFFSKSFYQIKTTFK